MAVGVSSGLLAAATGAESQKWLQAGQSVQYWSASKGKWISAVVKAVDSQGAVQVSVKPKVWLSREEQSDKVKASGAAPKARQIQGPPSNAGHLSNGFSSNGTSKQMPEVPIQVEKPQPDKSKALFRLFSEFDARKQNESGASSGGEGNVSSAKAQKVPAARKVEEEAQSPKDGNAHQRRSWTIKESKPEAAGSASQHGSSLRIFKEHAKEINQYQVALVQQPVRSVRKKVTSLLWRVFYRVIRDIAGRLKQLKDPRRSSSSENPKALQETLQAALSEAESCLQSVCSAIDRKIRAAEIPGVPSDASKANASMARLGARLNAVGHLKTMLADVERYRATSGIGDAQEALMRSDQLYCHALAACPELGQAFNQRGLLAAQRGDRLKAVRCGFRSLLCSLTFPSSRENLLAWLSQVAEGRPGARASPQTSSANAALCRLQRELLTLSAEGAQTSSLDEIMGRAQAQLREAVGAYGRQSSAGDTGKEWLLDVLIISLCSAVHHVRPVGSSKAEWSGSSFWAWDWVVRLGLCLSDEVAYMDGGNSTPAEHPLLPALSLLGLLGALLLPDLWRSAPGAPFRDAIGQLKFLGSWSSEDARLLQMALPEDAVAAGLLRLPIVVDSSSCQPGPADTFPGGPEDEDVSDDEVVLCSPAVKAPGGLQVQTLPLQLSISGTVAMPKAAPEHLHDEVRRARLRFCCSAALALGRPQEALDPLAEAEEEFEASESENFRDEVGFYDNIDDGATLEELGTGEPDLWDMPDRPADPNGRLDEWHGRVLEPWSDLPGLHPQGLGLPRDSLPLLGPLESQRAPAVPEMVPEVASLFAAAAAASAFSPPPGLSSPRDFAAMQSDAAMCSTTLTGTFSGQNQLAGLLTTPPEASPLDLSRAPPGLEEDDGCNLPMVDLGFLDEDAQVCSKDADAETPMVTIGLGRRNLPPPPTSVPPMPPPPGLENPKHSHAT